MLKEAKNNKTNKSCQHVEGRAIDCSNLLVLAEVLAASNNAALEC
jgi:hypothetical protein